MTVNPPAAAGVYPVTVLIDPLGINVMTSVVATLVAAAELTLPCVTVWQAYDAISEVARARDPLAMVVVKPPAALRLFPAAVITPVPKVSHPHTPT